MIINGIEFEVIVTVRKTRRISAKIKTKNTKHYLYISSYKRMDEKAVLRLINEHKPAIDRLISKMVLSPLKEDEILILGKVYEKKVAPIYLKDAQLEIVKLFDYYKNLFNKQNVILVFKKMTSRWGVCYLKKDQISLTEYIVSIPLHLIEYVIIHEFCHFTYPNHSKKFYDLVSEFCPEYKRFKKELKSFSYVLN